MTEVIAVCGAGGKTSYIWKLRDQYVALGKKVVIVTTTHMYRETFTDTSCDAVSILATLERDGWVMAGAIDPKHPEKIMALPEAVYEAIYPVADYILVEADGSKHCSVKCPNEQEPVLPDHLTKICLLMGTWDIGRPIYEVMHRVERYLEYFPETSHVLTWQDIEQIIEKCYLPQIRATHAEIPIERIYTRKTKNRLRFMNDKNYNSIDDTLYVNRNQREIIVRGGGDLATAVIHRLTRAGFPVLVLETDSPAAIRRQVSFCEAIYEGTVTIEGIEAVHIHSLEERFPVWAQGKVPVYIDPQGSCIPEIAPYALVDAIIAKRNLGTNLEMAPLTIGIGPGFEAGVDVDYVIESMRGHNLGRIISEGCAMANTGAPGEIGGYTTERVIHAPAPGIMSVRKTIGDIVETGEWIATVEQDGSSVPVLATIPGILRGMIRDGYPVTKGFKIADIDPRIEQLKNCFTISDKARCIAGSVLELVCMPQHTGSQDCPAK